MTSAEIGEVWRIVSFVALLGNVVFTPKPGLDREVAVVGEERTIQLAAAALGCTGVEVLRLPMVRKQVTVAGDSMDVEFTCKAACQARATPLSRVHLSHGARPHMVAVVVVVVVVVVAVRAAPPVET